MKDETNIDSDSLLFQTPKQVSKPSSWFSSLDDSFVSARMSKREENESRRRARFFSMEASQEENISKVDKKKLNFDFAEKDPLNRNADSVDTDLEDEYDDDVDQTDYSSTHVRSIGALGICFVAYFNASGGPWGAEPIISTLGPFIGFSGIFITSFLWALPLSMVTAELSSVYPYDGGYSLWVTEAFGEFWGFQESYWSWLSGVIDTAVYPVLAFKSVIKLLYPETNDENDNFYIMGFGVKIFLTLLFSSPALFTVRELGNGLGVLALFVAIPFLLFSIYNYSFTKLNHWEYIHAIPDSTEITLEKFMDLAAILYWNFSGLDCVSTVAGEVIHPARSYKIGLSLSIILIILTYIIPLSAAVVSVDQRGDWNEWEEGSFVQIGMSSLGHWFGIWIVVASIVGNAGMHAAEVFEDSWQLLGMAEAGLAPKIFARRHPRFGTPYISLGFGVTIVCALVTMEFKQIVSIDNFFSVGSALLELLAFVFLRFRGPVVKHSFSVISNKHANPFLKAEVYRIPIYSKLGLFLFLLFPFCLGGFVMMSSLFESFYSWILDLIATLFGFLLFWYMKRQGTISYKGFLGLQDY